MKFLLTLILAHWPHVSPNYTAWNAGNDIHATDGNQNWIVNTYTNGTQNEPAICEHPDGIGTLFAWSDFGRNHAYYMDIGLRIRYPDGSWSVQWWASTDPFTNWQPRIAATNTGWRVCFTSTYGERATVRNVTVDGPTDFYYLDTTNTSYPAVSKNQAVWLKNNTYIWCENGALDVGGPYDQCRWPNISQHRLVPFGNQYAISWQGRIGTTWRVYVALYDSNLNRISSVVNFDHANADTSDVAMDAAGIVVCWVDGSNVKLATLYRDMSFRDLRTIATGSYGPARMSLEWRTVKVAHGYNTVTEVER